METEKNLSCPSYVAKPGAKLYGIVNSEGQIDFLKDAIEVDETFIQKAMEGRAPEKRFRFAGNCAKSGCKQWSAEHAECGLINTVIDVVGKEEQSTLPDCAIRSTCRWYHQQKGLACSQCNEVIRNIETALCG